MSQLPRSAGRLWVVGTQTGTLGKKARVGVVGEYHLPL